MELSSSSSTGSCKRAKAPNQMVVVSCLVDGCNSDLSQCREYHRRHKVCEPHAKSPIVTISGRHQRFCQQCSRFHSLQEFDEAKRSCRKRLDGHNRRRRKPQSDSLPKTTGLFFSTPQGMRVLSFGGSQPHPDTSSAWFGCLKPEIEGSSVMFNNNSSFPITTPPLVHGYGEMNKFQMIPGNASTSISTSNNNSDGVSNRFTYCDGINGGPDRALSLLSSMPTRNVGSLQFQGAGQMLSPYSQEMENKGVFPNEESRNINTNTTLHFQGIFQDGPDAGCGGSSHQTQQMVDIISEYIQNGLEDFIN